jgi:serine/threonine protein kinase
MHSDGSNQASSSSDTITTVTTSTTAIASVGTAAPASSRRTQAVDIFSLGCIFHHCLCPGSHPFGEWYEVSITVATTTSATIAIANTAKSICMVVVV